jgi:hypothetical protein
MRGCSSFSNRIPTSPHPTTSSVGLRNTRGSAPRAVCAGLGQGLGAATFRTGDNGGFTTDPAPDKSATEMDT